VSFSGATHHGGARAKKDDYCFLYPHTVICCTIVISFSKLALPDIHTWVLHFARTQWLSMVSGMANKFSFDRLKQAAQAFLAAREGNVAVIFTLAIIPILAAVGAAVDYTHASSVRAALQGAIDSTALMLSKDAATLSSEQLTEKANGYFSALFQKPDAKNVALTTTYSTAGGYQVKISATAAVGTSFMNVMGISEVDIGASSTVKWGNTRLRVALVLDNTGSMSQSGKMTALKTATKNLLDQLKDAALQNGDVYVSIIPFVKDIAVDPLNYSQNWIDWTDWDASNGTCSISGNNTQSSCTSQGTCSIWGYWSQSSCTWHSGTWTAATWTPKNHASTWNGCITDRGNSGSPSSGNYDTNVTPPDPSNTATLFPAEQYGSCPQAVTGLSYDWSTMKTAVDNMSPNGNTNQAIGLVWGWMSLVGGGPFTVPAMDPNYKYQQVIILFTDGLNTQDRWYTSQSSIDSRQQMTCNNVKAAGITVYSIQVNTGGDPTSTLLQNCASGPDKFFLLTSADQIVTTFNQIGTVLSNLRIAK
jgi:Flp pilus assembly protein TadG